MNENYGQAERAPRDVDADMGAKSMGGAVGKVSPTLELIGNLRASQGETHAFLEALESRLNGVLMPSPPANKTDAGKPEPLRSPLCDELARRLDSEHSIHARIRDLLDRLTV